MDPFEKVLDSSIWHNSDTMQAVNKKDGYIRMGQVLDVKQDTVSKEIKYLVEVWDRNDKIPVWCKLTSRFGGVYNYEEYSIRGYKSSPLSNISNIFANKAGDTVIVAFFNGESREGVILDGIKHPGRTSKLKVDDGPAYTSEFNGVETLINKDGEYSLTFKGVPVNVALLKAPSAAPIVPPIYNPATSGSFIKFDKTGSIEINDKALALPLSIKLDKSGGKIEIKAGMTELAMEKLTQAVTLKSNTLSIDSKLKIEAKTLQFSVDATASIKLKAKKVAIGTDGIELFDQLIQLIDAIGKIQTISPVGPCTPLMTTTAWGAVTFIKGQLMAVKGSL